MFVWVCISVCGVMVGIQNAVSASLLCVLNVSMILHSAISLFY